MKKILLISEKHALLGELYRCLHDLEGCKIEIVPYSANAFERFVKSASEIVVIDQSIRLPFRTLLAQLAGCPIPHQTILICYPRFSYESPPDESIICLPGDHLSPESLHSALEEAFLRLSQNTDVNDLTAPQPDYRTIILAKYVGENDVDALSEPDWMDLLISSDMECTLINRADLLFHFPSLDSSPHSSCYKLRNKLLAVAGDRYTFFLQGPVTWEQLKQAQATLLRISRYAYFRKGEFLEADLLRPDASAIALDKARALYHSFLKQILHNDFKGSQNVLSELYLGLLKKSMDFQLLFYLRAFMQFFNDVFRPTGMERLSFSFRTIEAEYDGMIHLVKAALTSEIRTFSSLTCEVFLYLFDHYDEDLSLESTAQKFGVSRAYLSRILSAQLGRTFLDILQALRLELARYYLEHTDHRIYDVARAVGYQDAHYFSRFFRIAIGLSPNQYRAQNQHEEGSLS